MAEQIKYSFDAISLKKMGKGMLYAIAPSVLLGVVAFLKEAKWESTIVSMVMPWVVMVISNAVNEWIKGIPKDEVVLPKEEPSGTVGTEPDTRIDKSF